MNDGGDLIGTLLVCDDTRKSQILGTLLYDDGCVQPITNRLYDNDPVMLYFEHYLMMNVVLKLEHYLFLMTAGKLETQNSKYGGVIIGTLLVFDDSW